MKLYVHHIFQPTGHCNCLGGGTATLSKIDELESLAQEQHSHLEVHEMELWLFPSLGFSCHGYVVSWKAAASALKTGNGMPELSLWRKLASTENRYIKTSGQLMTTNPSYNFTAGDDDIIVHTGTFDVPYLRFEPGDILGLLLRRMEVASYIPYLQSLEVPEIHTPLGYYTIRAGSPKNDTIVLKEDRGGDILPLIALELCTCMYVYIYNNELQ